MASMAGFSVSPFLLELNSVAAMAQQSSPTDYRALVCIFLAGGNDGHGTVIATDAESFSAFTTARSGAPGLAYSQSDLLPIVLKTPLEWPHVCSESVSNGGAESFQCGTRSDCYKYGDFDRSYD
jgi:hypothetical protein